MASIVFVGAIPVLHTTKICGGATPIYHQYLYSKQESATRSNALDRMEREEAQRDRVFTQLSKDLQQREDARTERRVYYDKQRKIHYLAPMTKAMLARKERNLRKEQKLKQDTQDFLTAAPFMVTKISIAGGKMPSDCIDIKPKWELNKTPRMKKRQIHKDVKLSEQSIQNLMKCLFKIASQRAIPVEVVEKHRVKIDHTRYKGERHIKLPVRHLVGLRGQRDYYEKEWSVKYIQIAIGNMKRKRMYKTEHFGKGSSGLVIPTKQLVGHQSTSRNGYFVIRGNHEGKLIDARVKISVAAAHTIVHYSTADMFWKGYEEGHAEYKPKTQHMCKRDVPVEECGKATATLRQLLAPSGMISCRECIEHTSKESTKSMMTRIARGIIENADAIKHMEHSCEDLASALQCIGLACGATNTNYEDFGRIKFLIGDRLEAPFNHANKLNEILIKGNEARSIELHKGTEHLLEIVRFLKNRTDIVASGSIRNFRNKVSNKTTFNSTLFCDNQRDDNGNFIWGARGYHAKRFFNNYFDEIKPDEGYSKYIERKNPNGTRKLAIGNLIVPTNLEQLRVSLKGEQIDDQPVSEACVSRRGDHFIYPCCCMTNDDGSALRSALILPTKNHLVVGNTGDSKLVDLPTEISESLYMAKEGFCYINIFLAMLVNVPAEEAKDFTKRTRDLLVQQLKQWPTLLDVATACHFLMIFHPDTKHAELPKMLVDHKQKIIHVVDSYGSINTGYHILKANTVSQLTLFAEGNMTSEIQSYRVGGLSNSENCEGRAISMLIRSIFKPSLMKQVLLDDPCLLSLSLISPSILRACLLRNTFRDAIATLAQDDLPLKILLAYMEGLAKKVALSDCFVAQQRIIEDSTGTILDMLNQVNKMYHSTALTRLLVERIIAEKESDSVLNQHGFKHYKDEVAQLLEKNYQRDLADALRDAKWSVKFQYTSSLLKQLWCTIVHSRTLAPQQRCIATSPLFAGFLLRERIRSIYRYLQNEGNRALDKLRTVNQNCLTFVIRKFAGVLPEALRAISVLCIIQLTLMVTRSLTDIVKQYRVMHKKAQQLSMDQKEQALQAGLKRGSCLYGHDLSEEEFMEYIKNHEIALHDTAAEYLSTKSVHHQTKSKGEDLLEKGVAFIALLMMIFSHDRSDCVFKILQKLKGIVGTLDYQVYHQSLDDIKIDLQRNETINFELSGDSILETSKTNITFGQWWHHQLEMNATVPHYRGEGHFVEFTRATAANVVSMIAHDNNTDFLVRGAVGSGKSTNLPFLLSKKGGVLLIEPTRPLAENVWRNLQTDPFFATPTLRMRGISHFGSTPITIMTSGFALHFLANNRQQICNYQYIVFDECHVLDSNAMAFRCLLKEVDFKGKVLKVSATPPGRETDFKDTQYPIEIKMADQLTFQQFVMAQGSGSVCDVINKADNILVYVASYNEVDTLGKLLVSAGHKVTKVDGRTMKHGCTEIETSGSATKKHFIVATNIIENGVTLDIEAVVDFGMKVVADLDTDNRMITYRKQSISYGERIQRLGRVGRTKPGVALRIGHTEKGVANIPTMLATEAAFLSFTYGLPVMTSNVTTNLLSGCTVQQARVMQHFELPIFFTANLVRYDGSMHPEIHRYLQKYKMRDSEIVLNKLAIPYGVKSKWLSVGEYNHLNAHLDLHQDVKIPFLLKEFPEKFYEDIWNIVEKHKRDAAFSPVRLVNANTISYTLQTDVTSIKRTLQIIDHLIVQQTQKQAEFDALTSMTCAGSHFTLASIANQIKSRYASNVTIENISKLQAVKAQLMEFESYFDVQTANTIDEDELRRTIMQCGALNCVMHESASSMSQALNLKGVWNKSLITNDILVLIGVCCGCAWILYNSFLTSMHHVDHEGRSGNKKRLKFRDARDRKVGREIFGDDDTIEHYFGAAYTAKGKQTGKTHGLGTKTRRFVNMYGFDPTDYNFIRFVDPLTGETLDDSPLTDISLVQNHFHAKRHDAIVNDVLDPQRLHTDNGIQAYLVKDAAHKALRVDLTQHKPLVQTRLTNNISGFPERENELRQTGQPVEVDYTDVPKKNENVSFEAKSLHRGLRDYNPIASNVCQLTNDSDGVETTLFGVGYGSLIITNQHLFRRNNGTLRIRTKHGVFFIKNTATIKMLPVPKYDLVVFRLPKDCPPFAQRLKFREPIEKERICMVGTIFQERSSTSVVSETSNTFSVPNSTFWKHWIDTKDGNCGLPLVSVSDGSIVGLHSLTNMNLDQNYFVKFPENFEVEVLKTPENNQWVEKWKYNADTISWGSLKLQESHPTGLFKVSKLVTDLFTEQVKEQSNLKHHRWMYEMLHGNLQAVADCPSQLVTKHIVKGKCALFDLYLREKGEAKAFFEPLMGAYGKSKLNKDAYIKDILKYASDIVVGEVDTRLFEIALEGLEREMRNKGFQQCEYVTDSDTIINSLNMKAATGALYTGKKKDFFQAMTSDEKQQIVQDSCHRLYMSKLGIWNGSLKAELRPMEKVLANKTRTFTAAPLDTLLGGKVCVDDFNNQFYSLNTHCPWSVGMTKFFGGWNRLLEKLPEGWIYCDADGSQFDSSLSPYLINAILQLRLNFMEEWDIGERMLKNLYTEIVYTPISTPDGTIIKKYKGNNSGQPSTVVDNTLMVLLTMKYTLLKCGIPIDEQEKVCVYFANGDDLLIALHPEKQHLLDQFQECFAELGLKYTFDSRCTQRDELWFMSHRGIQVDSLFIPKLEQERIVSILEWDRATEPEHRLEAICAAMIEAWGYSDLLYQIRLFYQWVLEQAPYNELARIGRAPYIAESALRKLYTGVDIDNSALKLYYDSMFEDTIDMEVDYVQHQSGTTPPPVDIDAGQRTLGKKEAGTIESSRDRDINAGTTGLHPIPRLVNFSTKMKAPKYKKQVILNFDHLLVYTPNQIDLSNARATQAQFDAWYEGVKDSYQLDDEKMQIIMNGLMVWCIENGTSPDIHGVWTMMEGDEQVEFPLKPVIENAQPTLRQVMRHFSDVAEAYIEKRNQKETYMPRYGLIRNLTDKSLARYAFDFYEMTAKTPNRAKEAHLQMKAAAIRGASAKMFGLDGNLGQERENTERHTVDDVNQNMHNLLGMRGM